MAEQEMEINFGELSQDNEFKERINNFSRSIEEIRKIIDELVSHNVYEDLTPGDKVRYDLFLSFTINTLFWCYLRTQGVDPSQHDLKNEISRVKEYMAKSRRLYEQKTIMPRIDQGAAKRFIRAGLFDPENQNSEKESAETAATPSESQRGKRKREDSEGE